MVLQVQSPDLTADGAARWVVKDEVVSVEFAAAPSTLASAVGLNRYVAGDALLTGSTGDRWCVSCATASRRNISLRRPHREGKGGGTAIALSWCSPNE